MSDPSPGYLAEAVEQLQDTWFNQAILAYALNPKEGRLRAINDYLLMQHAQGNLDRPLAGDAYDEVKTSLDKLAANDKGEWRQLLAAIRPMEMDFQALSLLSPLSDEELQALTAG